MALVLRLLGRFDLVHEPGGGPSIAGARMQLLFARLAMARGGWLDRAELCTMLWADRAEAQARASLRQAIFTLRQNLKTQAEAIQSEGEALRLDPASFDCDVTTFGDLARLSDTGSLERALTLYRGDLLEGADLTLLDPGGYFLGQRQRLRDLALKVVTTLIAAHGQGRDWDGVVRVARRGLVLEPYAEDLNARLVAALQSQGRHREARDQDAAFRQMMSSELGLALSPQLPPAAPRPSGVEAVAADKAPGVAARANRPVLALAAALVLVAGIGLWQLAPPRAAPSTQPTAGLPTPDLRAYDLYLRAEARRRTAADDAGLRDAIDLFQQAVALDPDFVDAHAGLALAAVAIAQRRFDALLPPDASRNQVYDAAGLALQRDPENAHALIALSRLQAQDGAPDMALISAKRAVLSRPRDAEARANLALLLSRSGAAFRARAELTELRRLDPMPRPEDMLIYAEIAFADGRYDAAIADLVAAWPELPQNQVLLTHLSAALAIRGQLGQAQTVLKHFLVTRPGASLHQIHTHYAPFRSAPQNQRLLDGLRRAGLPVWSNGAPLDRVTGAALAALVGQVPGSPSQFLRGDELCRTDTGQSVCGSVFAAPPNQGSDFVFLAPTEVRFFPAPPK